MTLSDSRNKARALVRIKRLASSGLPLDPLVRTVFELINDAVPNSPNRVLLAGGGNRIDAYVGSTEEIARATPLFYKFFVDTTSKECGVRFPYDGHALRDILPSRIIWTQSDLVLENFFRADAYNMVYRPLGWHHLLQVVFQEGGKFLGYCPIWRSADQKPFSRDDVEFLRNAAAHIAHGLRTAQLLEGMEFSPAPLREFEPRSAGHAGTILLDAKGKLLAIDPDARLFLQQLGILDGVTVDQFTPAPARDGLAYISRMLAEIFRGAESHSERTAAPVYRLYHHWTGIVLKLRGFRMIGTDGREYTTILIERGETAEARRQRTAARWGLSPREAQILTYIGDGKTGPEIALILAISHDTVRKHTSAILDKLCVENRTTAAMLIRDANDT